MSTGQMDNKTYDVIFVARKNAEDNEGVMIAYHGTTVQPEGSEWWFH